MSMTEWGKKEIELAIEESKKEKLGEGEDALNEYVEMVYKSALELFEKFCDQNHSGLSASLTKNVFNRLVEGKPITPINLESEDIWNSCDEEVGDQCNRMFSLFRRKNPDGSYLYSDTDRIICQDIANKGHKFNSGLVNRIVNELIPIKSPYSPVERQITVYTADARSKNCTNGADFDLFAIFYAYDKSAKQRIEINKFYKFEEKPGPEGIRELEVEITEQEFVELAGGPDKVLVEDKNDIPEEGCKDED